MKPRPAQLFALAVPVLALFELLLHCYFSRRAPSVEAWQQLRSEVATLKPKAGPVVISPAWALPLARHAFGDELMPLAEIARPELQIFPAVLAVSSLGQSDTALSAWPTRFTREIGPFRVSLHENPHPVHVFYDFVEQLNPAQLEVWEQSANGLRICEFSNAAPVITGGLPGPVTFPAQRFLCSGGLQHFVGVTVIDDQHYQPRRCIAAHAAAHNTLRLKYKNVPVGSTIRGFGGISYLTARDGEGPNVELRALVNGLEIGRYTHVETTGWHGFEFRAENMQSPAEVIFEIQGSGLMNRQFCFYADAR